MGAGFLHVDQIGGHYGARVVLDYDVNVQVAFLDPLGQQFEAI